MKILFVNRFFFPDHSATSQLLSDLAFALSARGHRVAIITSALTYDGSTKLKRRDNIRGVDIVRVPTTAFGRDRLLGRIFDYLTFYPFAFLSLMSRARRGDIIVVKTDPPILSALAAPICSLKGASQINWLQDIFPEVAEALSLGKGWWRKLGLAFLRALRNASLRGASLNIVLGETMALKLKSFGVSEQQIQVIANWASGEAIRPIAPGANTLRKEWGLEAAFVVGYSGNLGRAHEIETFLAAMEVLEAQASKPGSPASLALEDRVLQRRLCWLFIGGGAEMDKLKREVERRQLKRVLFKPYQPRELLSESLSLPDVHLISLRPSLEGLVVPSKYYGIAAAGRPAIFVGHSGGEIAQIIERSATGFVVQEGDGAGLVRALLALRADPDLAAGQGRRARELFEAEFDFALAAAKWESVIKQVAFGVPSWKSDLETAERRA